MSNDITEELRHKRASEILESLSFPEPVPAPPDIEEELKQAAFPEFHCAARRIGSNHWCHQSVARFMIHQTRDGARPVFYCANHYPYDSYGSKRRLPRAFYDDGQPLEPDQMPVEWQVKFLRSCRRMKGEYAHDVARKEQRISDIEEMLRKAKAGLYDLEQWAEAYGEATEVFAEAIGDEGEEL